MADRRDNKQVDLKAVSPIPQSGNISPARSAYSASEANFAVSTSSYCTSSPHRNDAVNITEAKKPDGISTIPPLFEHDIDHVDTSCTDTFKVKRQILDGYASDLAESVWNNVELLGVQFEDAEALANVLPDFLRQMALRLGNMPGSHEEQEARAFVYRNRIIIAAHFRVLANKAHSVDDRRTKYKLSQNDGSLHQKVANWIRDMAGESPQCLHSRERDCYVQFLAHDDSMAIYSPYCGYREFIFGSMAYRWLLSTIGNYFMLNTDNADSMILLRANLLQTLEQPFESTMSALPPSEISHVELLFDWSLESFLFQQFGDKDLRLGDIITLTGRGVNAQALTCSSYLRQTWPCTGLVILGCVQDAFDNRKTRTSDQAWNIIGGTTISARFIGTDHFVLHVQGIADVVADVAEQVAWLVGSLRQSTLDSGPVSCRPRIQEITKLAMHFRVRIRFDLDRNDFVGTMTKNDGHCWYNMFRNPVVVTGYPILRRPTKSHGLEVPLTLMAELIGGNRINDMMGNHYIKGLRSMLVISGEDTGIINWHHLVNANEHRISYSYGYRPQENPVLASSNSLSAARHIVGWCPKVLYQAGAREMNYAIKRSGLPQPGREISLEKFTLGLSHIVAGGATFGIGAKDTPIHVSKGDYIGKLRWISRKYVVLWDEQDKRGWLVNGVSALLHALLGSLEFSRTDVFKSVFELDIAKFQHNQTPNTPTSAIEVLLNEDNRRMVLYPSSSSTTTETVVDKNGVATSSTKTTTTNYTVEDKVIELYEYFERMIEYKTTIETCPGIKTKIQRPLQHLEGWDFNELVSMRDPLYLRVATLGPNSFSWVKFTRSIHAITLFGKGFGNILKNAGIEDRVPCHHLSEVPTQQSYLSVGNSDMMNIIENFDGDTTTDPVRLTTNLVWHNASFPRDPFDACPCIQGSEHTAFPVQQILPSGLRSRLKGPTNNLDDFEHGAVVFGQSNPLGLCRWILSNHGKCEEASRPMLNLPDSHQRNLSADQIDGMSSSHQSSSGATTQSPKTSRSPTPERSSPMTQLTSSYSDRLVAPSDSSSEAEQTSGQVTGTHTAPAEANPSPALSHKIRARSSTELNPLSAVSSRPSSGPFPDITISNTPIIEPKVNRRPRLFERFREKHGADHS